MKNEFVNKLIQLFKYLKIDYFNLIEIKLMYINVVDIIFE